MAATRPLGPPRQLRPRQRTEVWVAEVGSATPRLVHESATRLLEAPNGSPDGRSLLLNGVGLLWRLDLACGDLEQVALDGVPPLNNDHVMDGDRGLVYVSANDGHIWVAPLGGGSGRRVTHDDTRFHFLHGVSPDGTALAFVELPVGDFSAPGRLALVPADRGATRYPRAGFPHLSPDGTYATYISFPPGTLGHPPDLPVEVRLVRTADWRTPVATFPVPGGQGTLNVNSWAPDSRRFAFVSYPIDGDCGP